jgi:hypothetical protein
MNRYQYPELFVKQTQTLFIMLPNHGIMRVRSPPSELSSPKAIFNHILRIIYNSLNLTSLSEKRQEYRVFNLFDCLYHLRI